MGAGGKKHNNSCKTLRLCLGCNQINRQAFIAVFEWLPGGLCWQLGWFLFAVKSQCACAGNNLRE
jgi:hypothetical protein